eukprot:m51a1_g2751 hypothetical protein (113) ;mRNA; r:962296-962797
MESVLHAQDKTEDSLRAQTVVFARDLVARTDQLRSALLAMTTVSIQCTRTYRMAVDGLAEQSSESMAALQSLVEKCRGLSLELETLSRLHAQIKEMKIAIEMLDSAVHKALK